MIYIPAEFLTCRLCSCHTLLTCFSDVQYAFGLSIILQAQAKLQLEIDIDSCWGPSTSTLNAFVQTTRNSADSRFIYEFFIV